MKRNLFYSLQFHGKKLSLLPMLLLFCATMMAQNVKVNGTVVDEDGIGLPGVNILVVGTTTGTISDVDGNYELTVPQGSEIQYSFTGYASQTFTANSNGAINVSMATDAEVLGEVVVTGYSSQRKRDITGAVAVIDSEDLNQVAATSFIQKLEGQATGVNISTSGAPGAATAVRIRGISSFQNNDPLYIIDGVPVKDAFGTGFNPNDIESIQVLKDASAASIYGARANNGVIIITTKKGKSGKARVTYDTYYGVQTPVGQYNLITNPADYSEVVWRAHEVAGLEVPESVPYAFGRGQIPDYIFPYAVGGGSVDESTYSYPDNLIMRANQSGTDWWDEVFDPAPIQEHNLAVSGGTDASNYYISASYLDQQGTMIHTDFERLALRANSNFKAGERWNFGENFSFTRSTSVGQPGGNQDEGNIMTQILKAQSIIPVYDVSGVNFAGGKSNGLSNGSNPVALLTRNKDNRGRFYRALGNAYAGLEIIDGLTAKTSIGLDFFQNATGGFRFPTWENSEPNTTNGWSEENQNGLTWTWTNTLNYAQSFGKSNVNLLVGYEAIKGQSRTIGGSLTNYFTTDINAWYLSTGLADPDTRTVYSYGGFSTLASAFAKIDYGFDDKYIISATVRRDGSSNFGDEKYGVFPAVSVGWRIAGEDFLKDSDIIDDLKIRAGWGVTGNQEIPGGNAFDRFGGGPGNSFYAINGGNTLATGYALTNRGNANTKWEENTSLNVGLDAVLLEGKINFVFDWYDRTTDGLLFNPALPATAGLAGAPFVNIAEMQNTGIDISASYRDNFGDLGIDIGANFGTYTNTILDVDGESESFFAPNSGTRVGLININQVGSSIGTFYGFQADGIFRSQAEVDAHATQDGAAVGRLRFKDISGDGVINDDDLGVIGSPHPDFTLGFNLGLTYKNFDLSTFWFASVGNEIYNYNRLFEVFRFFNTNVRTEVLERAYHPTLNPNGDWPSLDENDTFSERPSDFYVEDGSYLRAKVIQLGYTLPSSVLSNLNMSQFRIYVQAQNPFTITNYSGIDPALSNFDVRDNTDQFMGIDFGNYPGSRVMMIGLNVGF